MRVGRDVYGLDGEALPLGGERDRNFLLRAEGGPLFVLKFIDTDDAAAALGQVRVLRHLQVADPSLPVPRIVSTAAGADFGSSAPDGRPHKTLLLTHLPGRHLPAVPQRDELLPALGAVLGKLDRALEGFFDPVLEQRLAWDVRLLPELAHFTDHIESARTRRHVAAAVAAFTAGLPGLDRLRAQAIHGDCHANNVLVDDSGSTITGIVDFGDMIRAPLMFEAAVAMSEVLTEGVAPLAEVAALLQGYAQVQKLQAVEVDAVFDVIAARHATTILVHAWRCRHDPPGAPAIEEAAARAGDSLDRFEGLGRAALSEQWHHAAGTVPAAAGIRHRRSRLMGARAELFYEEPLHLVRGEDVWLYGADGRRYLDVYNNVAHVGHAHPAVVEAIRAQSALLATNTRYLHETVLDYAEQLTSRMPAGLDACLFVNSGSEANDVAWRIAQSATARRGALVMEHAYHGITDAVSALTPATGGAPDPRVEILAAPPLDLRARDEVPPPALAEAVRDADKAIAALGARGLAPAAFFFDSAFTSNGIADPPPAWLRTIAARVRAAGALIVGDEVQYGLGRSGSHFWGFDRRGLVPDIVTLGKPVGNGFPLGVVVTSRPLLEDFLGKCGFFSTFGGNAVAAAAGLAVIDVLERERLLENAGATGAVFRGHLEAVAARHACLGGVRGAGLLLGLEVLEADGIPAKRRAQRILNLMAARHGVLSGLEGPGGNVLKLRPPLTFRPEHAAVAAEAIDAAASACADSVRI